MRVPTLKLGDIDTGIDYRKISTFSYYGRNLLVMYNPDYGRFYISKNNQWNRVEWMDPLWDALTEHFQVRVRGAPEFKYKNE